MGGHRHPGRHDLAHRALRLREVDDRVRAGASARESRRPRLHARRGQPAPRTDGDLGFSEADRAENVRRAGEVACLFADSGMIAIVPLISPYVADRERVRARHEAGGLRFFEVFVDTPIEECERRDPKGLYAKARAGELKHFTGIDDPYEAPTHPDLHLAPGPDPESAAATIAALLDD